MEVFNNILFTNYELEENLNIYGILSDNQVFIITISKVKCKNKINNTDINNIFIPTNIINYKVQGYNIKFKIDDNYFRLNKFIKNINEFNFRKCLSLINCEIPYNIWIVVNSMIFQYCNFNNLKINKFEISENNENNEYKINGINKKYKFKIIKKNIKYELNNNIIFNKSENKLFIPINLTDTFLEGFIIETELNKIKQNIKKNNIIQKISKLEYCLIIGCVYTNL